ncbi:diguanylate cyclase [Viridibacterium curvum]|uniref:diguanylate cyclase n=1 Tax=Viridibacterium curvum TaxID=1101404 RepID=A0ABP9QUB8_9RHOO
MVNRIEIHAIWTALVQAWQQIWQTRDAGQSWSGFAAQCDKLLVLARQQGLVRIEQELMPLCDLLPAVKGPGEEEKAAVDRLLPGVFAAVREACSDRWQKKEGSQPDAGLPIVMLLVQNEAEWGDFATQMTAFGYRVQVHANYRRGMQSAITRRATAVLIELGAEGDSSTLSLISELNRYGPKWFAVAREASFELRLEAVRHGSQGFFVAPLQPAGVADALDPLSFRVKEEPYRVLVLDDSATVLASIRKALIPFSNIHVETLRHAPRVLDAMEEFSPDVLLLDFHMEGCNGLEVAKIIRQNRVWESIPIVYLTAETSEAVQLEAMRNGGDDYLTKPISQTHLANVVIAKAERYRGLRRLMVEDSLTGLYNHVRTKALLQQAMLMAERQHSALSYAILDIDHFKTVNDTYGHMVGDQVIRAIAHFLKQHVRRADVVGRYGGEEFVVIFLDTQMEAAAAKLDEMRMAFSNIQHAFDDGHFSVTFSAGVAGYPGYPSMAELMAAADEALYAAKRGGRNRVMRAGEAGNSP